jgi:hypothetical protein
MPDQPPTTPTRRNRRVLVAFGILGVLAVALVGGWVYIRFSGHNTAGLEGTWRDTSDTKHSYEFQPNGELATWYGSREWWNRIGWSATWRRDGQHIIIRTDRNWDLEGQLDGGTIRGTMLIRDQTGAAVTTADVVWQKE